MGQDFGIASDIFNLCRTTPSSSTSPAGFANPKFVCVIVSLALAALAGIAAYYCMSHGYRLLDMSYTSFQEFNAYVLIYLGVVFTGVFAANVVYGLGVKILCASPQRGPFTYTQEDAKQQLALSIFAPIVALPAAVYYAACRDTRPIYYA